MAYKLAVEEEAKDKAVKTKQVNLKGDEVKEKDDKCYFCDNEVNVVLANYTKGELGQVVCNVCLVKVFKVLSYAGTQGVTE